MKLKQLGVDVEVKFLPLGDVWVGNLIIEIKTIDDFFNSILGSNRYYSQLYDMMKSNVKAMVYVIGNYPNRVPLRRAGARLFPVNVVEELRRHKVISYYSFGIPVFQVSSVDEFIKDVVEFHNKSGKTVPSLKPVNIVRKADTIEDIRTNIYGSVPGIGKLTANYLGKHFPVSRVFKMSLDELRNVTVGDRKLGKRADVLYRVFNE